MVFRRKARRERAVLEALATAGEAGMTPLTLAVTTQLPEEELTAAVEQLVRDGAVTCWSERRPSPSGLLGRSGYRLTVRRPA